MNSLWERKNYLLDIDYLIATTISEYDIRKANISILYSEGVIDKSHYEFLYSADRMTRQVEVGYMIRNDKDIQHALDEGLKKYKKIFFEANGISDSDILSIKNDAVFIMKKKPSNTKFGVVEFVNKNSYSSFIKICKRLEVYFRSDIANNRFDIDIKGIADSKLPSHSAILSVIADVLYFIEVGDLKDGLKYISDFYNQYINRLLPIEFYRNFDDESQFIINAGVSQYRLNNCDISMINILDISYNLNVIQELYAILSNIYFSKNRLPG